MQQIARYVLAGVFDPRHDESRSVSKVLDGLSLADFWDVLQQDFGYTLKALSYRKWSQRMRAAIMASQEGHPSFPVMYILERGSSILGSDNLPKATDSRMKDVVKANIQYLINVGFLPAPDDQAFELFRFELII